MKRFRDNPIDLTVQFVLIVIILRLALPVPAAAESPERRIRITADRLVANTKTGSADFIGNVRAVQGSTVITADRLQVRYSRNGAGSSPEAEASIEAIIAMGQVVIHFDDKIATTEKAVYQSQSGIFTLTGKGTRVTSGDNAITGEKITVDRKNDRMTVEGGGESRVNAVIFTDKAGLANPLTGTTPDAKPGAPQ